MLAREFLETPAERYPDKVALVCAHQRSTYRELEAAANRLAQGLIASGVRPGDRVVVHLPNTRAAVIAIFAALKASAVFVPVNASTKPDKLAFILNHCRAAALVSEFRAGPLPETPWLKVLVRCQEPLTQPCSPDATVGFDQIQQDFSAERPPAANDEQDLACLIYTSGSTGVPKGVMCEHRQVVFASGSIIQYLELTEVDVTLMVSPLSFDYGLYQLLMIFRVGGTLVLENSFVFPARVLGRIAEERVTGFPGVPTIFALLLGLDLTTFDFSSLRYLTNTAAALPPCHVLELQRKFPRAKVFSMYGLTETKRALYLPPDQLQRRPDSVGIPIPGTQAWVEDEAGQRLAPGQVGELVIRGPHVMRGYWENPEATARRYRLQNGERVCCSGDLFRQDPEGFFYFVGRKDDIIKSRGEKVAPKEIENTLYTLPGVIEAAVIGVTDRVWGQAIKVFIVAADKSLTATRVLAHCRAHLEDFMVPQIIEFRESLPKSSAGKIDKLALAAGTQPRAAAAADQGAQINILTT